MNIFSCLFYFIYLFLFFSEHLDFLWTFQLVMFSYVSSFVHCSFVMFSYVFLICSLQFCTFLSSDIFYRFTTFIIFLNCLFFFPEFNNSNVGIDSNWELLNPHGYRFFLPGSVGLAWTEPSSTINSSNQVIHCIVCIISYFVLLFIYM